jgi:3-methyladenine DNA glycosylase AlkD
MSRNLSPESTVNQILRHLETLANPKNVAGMARFGIKAVKVLGISMVQLRFMAKEMGRNHQTANRLIESGVYEARILAVFIAEPKKLKKHEAYEWARTFECWADCDGFCIHLFRKAPFAHELALEWMEEKAELLKRAGFTMVATLAVHDKTKPDAVFEDYLSRLVRGAEDERHNVKKAVNWALRQIGKRNMRLHAKAINTAKAIRALGTPAARWIASDALRELAEVAIRRGWE